MQHCVFTIETRDTEREVLHDDTRRLSVDEVAVCESVLEHRHDGVDVVCRLGSNVLEDERERFQTPRADVQLSSPVFVEDSGDTGEGCSRESAVR